MKERIEFSIQKPWTKPFVRHECAISSPRLKGRLEKFGSQGKEKKTAPTSKEPKEVILRILHEVLSVKNLAEIIKELDGQQKRSLQRHPTSLSKGR